LADRRIAPAHRLGKAILCAKNFPDSTPQLAVVESHLSCTSPW